MARNTDWAQPGTGTLYTKVLTDLKDLAFMGSTMMHSDDDTTLSTDMDNAATEGAIKWSSASHSFEIYRSGWKPLRDNTTAPAGSGRERYAINVDMLDGYDGNYYRDISNMDTGVLEPARFDATSHGNIVLGNAHQLATTTIDGFMSKVQVQELADAKAGTRTDAEVAAAYNTATQTLVASNLTIDKAIVKKITGAALDTFIEAKLAAGVYAVTFKPLYPSGTSLIDVKRGQYQELIVSAPTAITFQEYPNNPYTMYLYITTNGNTVTVPNGVVGTTSHRWSGGDQPAPINSGGIDLLTINYDGKGNFFYMLLADMRIDTTP